MTDKPLHITNGNSLTKFLKELDFKDDILTWQEMLCEGPTVETIDSNESLKARSKFLNSYYDIAFDVKEFKEELEVLNHLEPYSEIVLWFEYDLFCHINMIAVIHLLQQKKIKLPIYLVCSGRVEGDKNLKGLSELSSKQLMEHYKNKITLTEKDLELATTLWKIYCGQDHNLFKPYIVQSSNFKYLNNCLKAHLERFPDSISGLNVLERNILEIVKNNPIKSKHHLLGYALNYQGYFGFNDIQLTRVIENLKIFLLEDKNQLTLNRNGHEALLGSHNFAPEIYNEIMYGGINRLDFQFSKQKNKLVKAIRNVH